MSKTEVKKKAPEKYDVLKHCLGHEPGDEVSLLPRQAVSLVAGGLLKKKVAQKPATRKQTEKKEADK